MAQVVRYIHRVNGTNNGIQQTVPLGSQGGILRKIFNSWPGLEGYGKPASSDAKPRLDPIAAFLLFTAVGVMVALYVFTPGYPDLLTGAEKYVIILAVGAAIAPIVVGGYVYKEWGPISRPLYLRKTKEIPDVALIGLVFSFLGIGIADTLLTNFGFFPTLSFWNSVTPQIFYASAGIIEEFVFRFVFFGAVNRFAPGLLRNPAVFFIFTGPVDSGIFTTYHLFVYATSRVALDLVFVEGYLISDTYRLLKYPLWVVMLLHAALNWTSAP